MSNRARWKASILLPGCSRDLHDYNGYWAAPHFWVNADITQGYPKDAPIGLQERIFGGARWINASPSAKILLGYANPTFIDTRPAKLYQQELLNYKAPPGSDTHNPKVIAWLRANLKLGREGGDLWQQLGACAYDRDLKRYYFIFYEAPPGDYEQEIPRVFNRIDRGIWYVSTDPDPGSPKSFQIPFDDIATLVEDQ